MSRFDQRGYLVKQIFGLERRYVAAVPGPVEQRVWDFPRGIASCAQSLNQAHEELNRRMRQEGR